MDISVGLGLLIALAGLMMGTLMEGGSLLGLIGISAGLIVFGGTIGVVIVAFGISGLLKVPKLLMLSLRGGGHEAEQVIGQLVSLSEKARREGLLSLEEESEAVGDPFLKKGLMLVIDGTDPEQVRSILEIDLINMEERHARGYEIFKEAGGFSPTLGIIGTVLGLIAVLSELGGNTEELGHSIALAFIATLYGVGAANLFWLPTAKNLELKSKAEIHVKQVLLEGIMSIQAGDNPRVVEEKLQGFLSPAERAARAQAGVEA